MAVFKSCSVCRKSWSSRDDFLRDRDITLIGYQPDFDDLKHGTLLFNHDVSGCKTTMEIEIERFADLYKGPLYPTSLKGTEECSGHCLRIENLNTCDKPCANAWARQVARIVNELTDLVR